MNMNEIIMKIDDLCINHGLSYDRTPPIQVSPGVFMFSVVEMNHSCSKHGQCRQTQRYAIMKGNRFVLG